MKWYLGALIAVFLIIVSKQCNAAMPRGVWSATCLKDGDPGMDYRKATLEFEGSKVKLWILNSQFSDCTKSPYSFLLDFQYTLPSSPNPKLYRYWDLVVTGYFLILHEESYAKYYNKIQYCGKSDWKVGTPQPISNAECGTNDLYDTGTHLYQIFRREKKEFLIGLLTSSENGMNEDARPTQIDPVHRFTKKKN